MNRDDAKNLLPVTMHNELGAYVKIKHADGMIDRIYDYVDSKTCENCKFAEANEHKHQENCILLDIRCADGFGCSFFENKN